MYQEQVPLDLKHSAPTPQPCIVGAHEEAMIADEANGSCPYRMEMQALTILF